MALSVGSHILMSQGLDQDYKLHRFDVVDILYLSPFSVLPNKTFGLEPGVPTARFEAIVGEARSQNKDIKIILVQWWTDGQAYDLLTSPADIATYADSVMNFIKSYQTKSAVANGQTVSLRIDGYDVDYEGPNTHENAPNVLTQVSLKLKSLGQYQVSVTPDKTQGLSTLANVLTCINMQNYENGRFIGPADYLRDIPGLKPSQLRWGMPSENPGGEGSTATSVSNGIELANSNGCSGIWTWRLNSDNWVYTNMFQVSLHNKVHKTQSATNLDQRVDAGWAQGGRGPPSGKPVAPYLPNDWSAAKEYRN